MVKDITSGHNNKNLVFTLSRENARNSTEVLRNLLTFSVTGSGNPVEESEGQSYAALPPVAKGWLQHKAFGLLSRDGGSKWEISSAIAPSLK